MVMNNVILVTYDISPYRGSEASVSWNYVQNMRQYVHLIVVYGNGKVDIERYLSENEDGIDNVEFINISPLPLSAHGFLLDVQYNLNYRKWHKQIYSLVSSMIEEGKANVVHYLNPIGFKEPGFFYKLPTTVRYIWGPMQGVENRPLELYKALGTKGKINAFTRRIVHNLLLRYHPRVRKAIKRADVIFGATPNTVKQLRSLFHRDCIYLPENGIFKMMTDRPAKFDGNILKLIWIGGIVDRKGLIILLDALRKLNDSRWHLIVLGQGYLEKQLKDTALEYGISQQIEWRGNLPRTEVFNCLKESHLHVISSLGEGNPTVIWEAMALGIPTLTLDHCGMSGVVCGKCGIKIPIISYNQVIDTIAVEIKKFLQNPSRLENLSEGVLNCSKNFMWQNRINMFMKAYGFLIYS